MTSIQGISAGNYLTGMIDTDYWLNQLPAQKNSLYDSNQILENSDGFTRTTQGETCTDGKDDGKIDLATKIDHTMIGAGKTIVSGIKGMFTNKAGNFSLGKTLLSVGAISAGFAFPPLGIGLCVAGGVAGISQLAKGISAASHAKTDAEAKEAWQNIGGGALIAGTSGLGARAGVLRNENVIGVLSKA